MKKPNLFIVGAPKAGTSFLYKTLNDHPQIFFPKIKELNHFSYNELIENSYYQDYKIENREKYLKLFNSAVNEKYLVDGSVSYFAFPSVAQEIFEFNPDAKIIISIRNPIKRAYSHFQMDKRMGNVEHSFDDYIHMPKGHPRYIQYIQNSLYHDSIQGFLNFFPREQIHVMVLENLEEELPKLFDFLDIKLLNKGIDSSKRVNENKQARNFIAKYFQKNRKLVSVLKTIIPHKLISRLNKLLYKPVANENIPIESERFLYSLFASDILSMSKFLNIDLMNLWKLKP